MQANRGRDTRPEKALRSAVHGSGLRYRVNVRPIPELRRTADIVFPRARVAVFLDGCFWHGCEQHYSAPVANSAFWREKVTRNMERDRETDERLEAAGWRVLRFWEHDDAWESAEIIKQVVASRRDVGQKGEE